ncbi:54S ribosomal protein L16, mitochondrial [Fulvia fulva]|uniref:54S ribosomal protein L16, mitochondrial n=1 Tax=Passalora fulva TaxID=5499 RepID=A0A9Q8L5F1_PASFU|nr:54S ribosomal protein L16, mitochondrial [Fulvia fulva]KAK4635225.1 54S ribosomal protein L16, mitochondrial [Fulvia fulva]KAK4636745.1 54S ribosomal protein L16, mitochondrial [Fulvia fulva]UJO11163.1 54S ribosomal protein L16, mitochondrial [Fulvia fulva]WPV08585.1 54S ribosomal protein L16, mitochondrial [Fulvia fulva]WPV23321.1 54S ribosomal protein L16, mitochondrial [Fulvia fulva]
MALPIKAAVPTSLLSSFTTRACCLQSALKTLCSQAQSQSRTFSSSRPTFNWLMPKAGESSKSRKGRCKVPTGGSVKGTTLVWGEYGIRLKDHDRRISAAQLKIADETIKKRLRGMKYRLYHRVSATIGVYTSGNDQRMGKGKGSFDHWAARVPVSRILFELKGEVHEQVVRDAMRLAGNKLPGLYEFVKKGDPPVMGVTKLGNGVTEESLRRPRMPQPNLQTTAERLPASTAV